MICSLHKNAARITGHLLGILLPSILLIVVLILVFNNRYQTRIKNLADAMEQITDNQLQTRLPVEQHDEIGRLSEQFNLMCTSLDKYIKLHYQAEVGRKTAELNALQAQINPHFLFNTIESIRMKAIDEGAYETSEMLIKMGTLFRWMISIQKPVVYLEDELEYNDAYITLQKFRCGDSFESDFEIDDRALYLGIPKFTLQPIVENAIVHGLSRGSTGLVQVCVRLNGKILEITVSDNGKGIPEAQLARLQAHIDGTCSSPEFGIGIRNVQSRIRLLFGSAYGVRLQSRNGQGTDVIITLPAQPKKEMEQYVSNASCG